MQADLLLPWMDCPIVASSPLSGGSNKQTIAVATDQQEYVLSVYATPADVDAIGYEHRLLRLLAASSMPFAVPTPLATSEGSTIAVLDWGPSSAVATLSLRLPGHHPDDHKAAHLTACGAALAQMHEALTHAPADFAERSGYPLLEQISPAIADPIQALEDTPLDPASQAELARSMAAVVDSGWAGAGTQPIHADPYINNMLVHEDQVTALLDFEQAGWGHPAMDIAIATLSLCLTPLNRPDRWVNLEALLSGYQAHRPTPTEELVAIPDLLLLREATSFVAQMSRHLHGQLDDHALDRQAKKFIKLQTWLSSIRDDLLNHLTWRPENP